MLRVCGVFDLRLYDYDVCSCCVTVCVWFRVLFVCGVCVCVCFILCGCVVFGAV